jgi:hypothetical protein
MVTIDRWMTSRPGSRTVPLADAMYLACTSDVLPIHPGYTCAPQSWQSAGQPERVPKTTLPPTPGRARSAATDLLQSQRILLSHPDGRASCRVRPRCSEPHYLVLSR